MIAVRNLSVRAGSFRLKDISFEIPTGAYGVLMGPTGTGKTTLLEGILGWRAIEAGRVELCGIDVTDWDPAARGIGYVPQEGALFPSLTVREHLDFALRIRRAARHTREQVVRELASLLGLEALLDRYPPGLSGGERQRVALGRALSFRPAILCLDEPLSALDSATRSEMITLLRRIQHQTATTTLHVTHNRDEAESLADYRLKLEAGRLVCE